MKNQIEKISYHDDKILFRESINFTAAKTKLNVLKDAIK